MVTTETEQETCVHRWSLETPSRGRRVVSGECKRCGLKRDDFTVAMPETGMSMWTRTRPKKRVCKRCGQRTHRDLCDDCRSQVMFGDDDEYADYVMDTRVL